MAELGKLRFEDCCHAVLNDPKSNAFAKGYAQKGLEMLDDPEKVKSQALYILSNLSHWRGPEAALVKASLKTIAHD